MRKSRIKPALLCITLGPIGLFSYSWQIAIPAVLLTITCLLTFSEYAILVWLFAIFLSTVIAISLLRANLKREKIDNFRPSSFIGTVSCKVVPGKTLQARRNVGYEPLLKKYRLRRRLNKAFNMTLAVLCTLMVYLIVARDHFVQMTANTRQSQKSETSDNTLSYIDHQQATLLKSAQPGAYTVLSTNLLSGKNSHYRAALLINCKNNKTNLALHAADILGTESSTVKFTNSTKQIHSSKWHIHSDFHTATANRPISTLRKIKDQNEIVVQYHTFDNDEKSTAHFDAELVNTAIDGVRKACQW